MTFKYSKYAHLEIKMPGNIYNEYGPGTLCIFGDNVC